jgi:hypothetical protein
VTGTSADAAEMVSGVRSDAASVRRRLMEQRALGRWITHASPPCPEGPGLLFSDGGRMMRGVMRPRQAAAWWCVLRSAVGDVLLSPGVALRLPPATRRDPSGVVDAPFRCDNDSSPRRICDRRESATWADGPGASALRLMARSADGCGLGRPPRDGASCARPLGNDWATRPGAHAAWLLTAGPLGLRRRSAE